MLFALALFLVVAGIAAVAVGATKRGSDKVWWIVPGVIAIALGFGLTIHVVANDLGDALANRLTSVSSAPITQNAPFRR